jgi:hypothetical protein
MTSTRDERDWLERTLVFMMCEFQFVSLMHVRITIVLVKLVSRRVEGLKLERRSAVKFCVILKKTATETFRMLKGANGEECLSGTGLYEWHERFREGRESFQDEEPLGRPSTPRTEKSAEVIANRENFECWDMRRNDRLNRETVCKILIEDVEKEKKCVPVLFLDC